MFFTQDKVEKYTLNSLIRKINKGKHLPQMML